MKLDLDFLKDEIKNNNQNKVFQLTVYVSISFWKEVSNCRASNT